MARGLMSLPMIDRVPSDSSFKRLKPYDDGIRSKLRRGTPQRESFAVRTTLRPPPAETHSLVRTTLRQEKLKKRGDSVTSGEEVRRPSSIFGMWRRRDSVEVTSPLHYPLHGSRLQDSSDDDDSYVMPSRLIGRQIDSDSISSSTHKKLVSVSKIFRRRPTRRPDDDTAAPVPAIPDEAVARDMNTADDDDRANHQEHRQSKSESILSQRSGKEKRFKRLRRLFRIKE